MSKEQISQAQYEKNMRATLFTVLKDLNESGSKDNEVMMLIGSLASTILNNSDAKDWIDLKLRLSPSDFEKILEDLQKQGSAMQASGKIKIAYAIQTVAVSLAVEKIKDEDSIEGNKLLNQIIVGAISYFNKLNKNPQPTASIH